MNFITSFSDLVSFSMIGSGFFFEGPVPDAGQLQLDSQP